MTYCTRWFKYLFCVCLCVQGPTLSVEQHIFCIFDKVKVTITLDDSNVQHQKIRMSLIEPVVRTQFNYCTSGTPLLLVSDMYLLRFVLQQINCRISMYFQWKVNMFS